MTTLTAIVTRPEPDASAFADALSARGIAAIVSPVMRIAFETAPPSLDGVRALAFTSANGVRAYARLGLPTGLPAYVVGEATAAEARAAGLMRVCVSGGEVAHLAAQISKAHQDGDLLYVAGHDRANDLAALVRRRGGRCRTAVLYRAVALPALSPQAARALREADGSLWVTLFSVRTAKLFLSHARGLDRYRVNCACLSAAIADAAGGGWRRVAIAADSSSLSLIESIRAADAAAP
jgi:uroporphyrinogen-III synthase